MEQRRLRLGDILDDYCPRERRVTNHAVVAMVEETVKQTRCTTCDADHPYKGGQAPRRRKKEGTSALFKEVLAGKPDTEVPTGHDDGEAFAAADLPVEGQGENGGHGHDENDNTHGEANGNVMSENDLPPATLASRPAPAARRELTPEPPSAFQPAVLAAGDQAGPDQESADAAPRLSDAEEGPVHRQLIRAQLPRVEGQKDERRPTDFTIRQSGGRGNNAGNQFRGGGGGGGGNRPRSGRGGFAGNGPAVPPGCGHGACPVHVGHDRTAQAGPARATTACSSCSTASSARSAAGAGAAARPPTRPPMPNLIPVSLSLWAGIYNVLFAFRVGAPVVLMPGFDTVSSPASSREHQIRSVVLPPAAMTMLRRRRAVTGLAPLHTSAA